MPSRQRWRTGLPLYMYIAMLLAIVPVALPLWNQWLQPAVGRWVTIQQIHLLEYLGLGVLAAWVARSGSPRRLRLLRLSMLCIGVALLDELVQGILPQRVFEWSDVWLNWSGSVVGLVVGWLSTLSLAGRRAGTQ